MSIIDLHKLEVNIEQKDFAWRRLFTYELKDREPNNNNWVLPFIEKEII